jgi:hypothetical protein
MVRNIFGNGRVSKLSEIGVVWNSKGDTFNFGLKDNQSVNFGEIIRVVSGKRAFYARVTNTASGYTLKQEDLLKEMVGTEGFGPYSKFRSVEANVMLESTEEGKLRLPSFNPTCGDKVSTTTKDDHQLLGLGGDLHIGYLRLGVQQSVPVGIQVSALPKHIGLFGMTGSGKTNTELIINARILDDPRTAGVTFDFHGELWEGKGLGKGLRDHPLFPTRGRYYTGEKVKVGIRALRTLDIFEMFPDLTPPQARACRELQKEMGETWVQQVIESDIPQGLRSLKTSVGAVLRRLHDLPPDVFPDDATSIADNIVRDLKEGVTTLVDLSGLNFEDQKRIACVVTRRVASEYKRLFHENPEKWHLLPTLLTTLEEAHEFLSRDPKKHTFFSNVALTYRKYRVGLCVVTPRPSSIDPDVFAELWTKIIMKTTFKTDREYLTENTQYLEYSNVEVKVLDQGEALLVSEPQLRFAVPIKTVYYPEYLEKREKVDYRLKPSKTLSEIDENLKRIRQAGKTEESLFKEHQEMLK